MIPELKKHYLTHFRFLALSLYRDQGLRVQQQQKQQPKQSDSLH